MDLILSLLTSGAYSHDSHTEHYYTIFSKSMHFNMFTCTIESNKAYLDFQDDDEMGGNCCPSRGPTFQVSWET